MLSHFHQNNTFFFISYCGIKDNTFWKHLESSLELSSTVLASGRAALLENCNIVTHKAEIVKNM